MSRSGLPLALGSVAALAAAGVAASKRRGSRSTVEPEIPPVLRGTPYGTPFPETFDRDFYMTGACDVMGIALYRLTGFPIAGFWSYRSVDGVPCSRYPAWESDLDHVVVKVGFNHYLDATGLHIGRPALSGDPRWVIAHGPCPVAEVNVSELFMTCEMDTQEREDAIALAMRRVRADPLLQHAIRLAKALPSLLQTIERGVRTYAVVLPDARSAWDIRSAMRLKGLDGPLGSGNTRAVFGFHTMPDLVLKIALTLDDPGDREVNLDETQTWLTVDPEIQARLVPVRAFDPQGRWLLMDRAFPVEELDLDGITTDQRDEAAFDYCERRFPLTLGSDCHTYNLGWHRGSLKLFDYAIPTVWREQPGWDEIPDGSTSRRS